MKFLFTFVGLAALALGAPHALQQPPSVESCHFALSGDAVKPTITGPEDITPLVYVIDQPDSPIEIVSLDFTGYMLSVANERYTKRDCSTMRVRNRSDQPVNNVEVNVFLSTKGYVGGPGFVGRPGQVQSLGADQETEIRLCNEGGIGGAPGNRVRIFAAVEQMRLNKCVYVPSKRVPYELVGL